MNPVLALVVVLAVLAATTLVGVLWRARNGAVRTADGVQVVAPSDVDVAGPFGERATLLQFSTEFCAFCPATRRLLGETADHHDGVVHVDVDLTHAPELAQRFNVLQTPTTLLLDGRGRVRARIGGAPRPAELAEHLDRILGSNDHVTT